LSIDNKDIVAYWSFDEGSGKTVSDDSGNGFDGTVKEAEWTNDGKIGSAMSFNSKGNYVDVVSDPNLDPGKDNWTIEFWLKRADAEGGWHKIMTKYPGNWTGYRIGFLDNTIHVIFGTGPAPNMVEFQTLSKIEDQEWHHLALVVDRKNDAIVYIDGKADEKKTSVKHLDDQVVATAQNLEIGRCHWCDGGKSMGFNGILDEIKIWRAALSEDEIATVMNNKLNLAVSSENALATMWGLIKK